MSEIKNCPFCGEEINESASKCKHCGEWLNGHNCHDLSNEKIELPKECKHFNWGACLLTWIWGIGNKTYITFLIFAIALLNIIPFVGWIATLAFCIWLGCKGNELSWKNNYWSDIEQFNNTQRKWAMWGGIINGLIAFLVALCTVIVCFSTASVMGY